MDQRVSLITLGVADLKRSVEFYARLGWHGQEVEETVFIQAGGQAVVLWSLEKLAADCGIDDDGGSGFGGIALAQNVRSHAEVDEIMAVTICYDFEARKRSYELLAEEFGLVSA